MTGRRHRSLRADGSYEVPEGLDPRPKPGGAYAIPAGPPPNEHHLRVRGLDGGPYQRGLADACLTAHQDRGPTTLSRERDRLTDATKWPCAAYDPRPDRLRRSTSSVEPFRNRPKIDAGEDLAPQPALGRQSQGRVLVEDALLELLQRRRRVDAQLFRQVLAQPGIGP